MKLGLRAHVLTFAVLAIGGILPSRAQTAAPAPAELGGSYAQLRPQQKRLVDDWFARFSAVVKKQVNPAEGYDKLPLSTKTTFNAVTHALLMTKLTDSSGEGLAGSAIELVDKVDDAAGQVLGAGGDEQFRIYVQIKPGGLELLGRSKEFKRGPDNTVYHKGYPTCFRSTGGTPSIQFSLTRDGTRGDVDVDYRSSKFPLFLMNGHLTASNSDVRAGNNDERHNNQWAGLQNWWRNILGLPLADSATQGKTAGRIMAKEPKIKGGKPADVVYDFLNGWLVGQKPDEAISYIADEAYACLDLKKEAKADRGMARFALFQTMMAINQRTGKVSSLGDVSLGVAIAGPRLKVIPQPHHAQFVLYDVREDLAEEFKCANKLDTAEVSTKAMNSKAFGKYVGAILRIRGGSQTGRTAATLWREEGGYWKMISYEVDPQFDRSGTPSTAARPPVSAPLGYAGGDSEMTRAASDFLGQWLLKKDVERALGYLAPECLTCFNHYRAEGLPASSTPAEARELLKNDLMRAAVALDAQGNLESAITAPQPHHPDLKLVKHAEDKAFVIVSIPDAMGDAASCPRRRPDGEIDFRPGGAASHGKYYATGFSIQRGSGSAATLWINWSKVNGSWKAVSYALLTP